MPYIVGNKKAKINRNERLIMPQSFNYFCPLTGRSISADEPFRPPKMDLMKFMWKKAIHKKLDRNNTAAKFYLLWNDTKS